jgi:hypothetical protein
MEDAKFREICSGLRDYESPVSPELWTGISKTSLAAKSSFSLPLAGKVAAGIVLSCSLVAGIYFAIYPANPTAPTPSAVEISNGTSEAASGPSNTGSPEKNRLLGEQKKGEIGHAANAPESNSTQKSDDEDPLKDGDLRSATGEDEPGMYSTADENDTDEKVSAENGPHKEHVDRTKDISLEVVLLSHQDEADPLLWMFSAKSHEAASYSWDFGDGSSMTGKRVNHRFKLSGTYKVCAKAIMPGGAEFIQCTEAVATYRIKVVLPNVFSPGGSPGVNDFYDLNIADSEQVKDYTLRIYSQEGLLVFESREDQIAWDGNDRFGNPMPAGNYLVIAEVKGHGGEVVVERQSLTLNR